MVPDGAKAVVDLGGTREDRAMPSRTATTMPLVDMVLAVVWEDGHRRAEVGLRELRRGPRATLAGLVTPEDGAREEDGQARPDGAPEAPTRAGLERLTALELLEVSYNHKTSIYILVKSLPSSGYGGNTGGWSTGGYGGNSGWSTGGSSGWKW